MKEKDRENVFVGKVLSTLDKSAQDLDPKTLSRLRHIRTKALETGKSSAWPGTWLGLGPFFRFPAAAIATAGVILLGTFLYLANPLGIRIHNGFDDAEILVTTDNLEFYEELDFYRWLTEEAGHSEKETHSRNGIPTQYVCSHPPWEKKIVPREDEKPKGRRLEFISFRVA